MLVVASALSNSVLYGQSVDTLTQKNKKVEDNIYNENIKKDRLPVDSINKKGNKFVKLIISSIYSGRSTSVEVLADSQEAQQERLKAYNNLKIDSIIFVRTAVGGDQKKKSGFSNVANNVANAIHATTKQSTVEKNLIMKQGDIYTTQLADISEYMLRETGLFTDVTIIPFLNRDSTLTIVVATRDKLTLGLDADLESHTDGYVAVYDRNFAGRGNTLRISEYYNVDSLKPFTAIGIEHTFNNILGTFTQLRTGLKYGKERLGVDVELSKEMIVPGDFGFGVGYLEERDLVKYSIIDSMHLTSQNEKFLWLGKSFMNSTNDNTPYIAMSYNDVRFFDEPGSTELTNPYFHDNKTLIGAVGVYREGFYKTNMVYGFGYTEDIPYGYNLELIGGYRWGEYNNYTYLGASGSFGNKTRFGYINLLAQTGGFVRRDEENYRHITKFDINYFSNLVTLRRNYYLRIFLRTSYINGSNMLEGEREKISLGGIRGLSITDGLGTTRLSSSLESVIFAPWQAVGFKFAMFGYCDFGTLGSVANPFKNDRFSTLGVGVRVRNDNLIFNTIEIRLSVVTKSDSPISTYWINAGSPSRVRVERFIAEQPQIVEYE